MSFGLGEAFTVMLSKEQRDSFVMGGDTKIVFCGNKGNELCRIMFNTSFIQNGNYI